MGKYLDNRLKFHTASRVGIETNQSLAGALNVDGHIVTAAKVWSAPAKDFPVNRDLRVGDTEELKQKDAADNLDHKNHKTSTNVIETTRDLVGVFTNDGVADGTIITKTAYKDAAGAVVSGAFVWENKNYPAVKLYEKVPMTAVQFSDGTESGGKPQAYEIKDGGVRVTDWVPPTAVIDAVTGAPVAGYTGIAEAVKGSTWTILQDTPQPNLTDDSYAWALARGNWEFVYISGMLTFDPKYTPTSANMGFSGVRYTGFAYKGAYLQTNVDTINDDITGIGEDIAGINEDIAGINNKLAAGIGYEEILDLTPVAPAE